MKLTYLSKPLTTMATYVEVVESALSQAQLKAKQASRNRRESYNALTLATRTSLSLMKTSGSWAVNSAT